MRVQILDMAEEDLVEGYWFYEAQEPGLGAYFRDSIYADLYALEKRQAFIASFTKTITGRSPPCFHSRCTTRFRGRQRLPERSSIAGETLHGSGSIWNKFASTRAPKTRSATALQSA